MIENEQLRQCVVDINQKFEHLLFIHRKPTEHFPNNDDTESFETRTLLLFFYLSSFIHMNSYILELMNLPCDAVNEIVQRHFTKIYDQIDRYILDNKIS